MIADSASCPIRCIYPGHGPVIAGREEALRRVDEYISHRGAREREILAALRAVGGGRWLSSWQLVGAVYGELQVVSRTCYRSTNGDTHNS